MNFVIVDHSGSSAYYIDTSVGTNLCGGLEPYFGTLFKRAQKNKFSNATLSGSYLVSLLVTYPGSAQHGVGRGLLTFDGGGKVSGIVSFIGDPPSVSVAVAGTYFVDHDGSATIRFPSLRVSPLTLGVNWSVLIADGVGTHSVFIDVSNDAAETTVGTLERQR
jgi:hypothetical protein